MKHTIFYIVNVLMGSTPGKRKMVFWSGLALSLMVGCDSGAVSSNENITESGFNAYLKLKKIPESDSKRIETEKQRFQQKEKMTNLILEQSVLDQELLDAEVNEYKKQLVVNRYFEKFLKEKVNEQAVKNYYASNPERYQSRKIHIAHVLVRTNQKMSKEEREALITKAHEIYSRANSNEDFAGLAQAYSDDKLSAKKGGELGWIKEGAIDKSFSNKIFTMKKGEISEPISTPYGFHIVKVLGEPKIVKQPFDAVKGNIRYELRQQVKQAETSRLLKLTKGNQ